MASFRRAADARDVLSIVENLKLSLEDKGLAAVEAVETWASHLVECALSGDDKQIGDIEYYLPQLCHMVIHMRVAWESQALERFAFAISQTNMHIALQLSFYLRAAMEDYQPELSTERPNPSANLELFYRCARLLQNVERAVVYGTPVGLSAEDLTGARRERAEAILCNNKANELLPVTSPLASQRRGYLLFKRNERKSAVHAKPWKERYFRIEQQVLFCLRAEGSDEVLRAMSLIGCSVHVVEGSKYGFQFEVENATKTLKYQLRAADEKSMDT